MILRGKKALWVPSRALVTKTWHITSFYKFVEQTEPEVEIRRSELRSFMAANELMGLVLLATEGVNGTVAGDEAAIQALKSFVEAEFGATRFKDSESDIKPFHRTTVVIRPEIVAIKNDRLPIPPGEDNHLSPAEWDAMLSSPTPKTVIDTRSAYETRLGVFEGAIDPGLKAFSDWGAYLDKAEIPRDQPVMIYCTGGIRCEKAILEMRVRGFEQVFQLRDGILGYLEEFPEGKFQGECFVFDDRVAVNSALQPTQTAGICPGCGLPDSVVRTCDWCGENYFSCNDCSLEWQTACSKTCLDRIRRHGPKQ